MAAAFCHAPSAAGSGLFQKLGWDKLRWYFDVVIALSYESEASR